VTAGRPTLETVARAAGVSPMTVSNAYNRPDQMSTLTTVADYGAQLFGAVLSRGTVRRNRGLRPRRPARRRCGPVTLRFLLASTVTCPPARLCRPAVAENCLPARVATSPAWPGCVPTGEYVGT